MTLEFALPTFGTNINRQLMSAVAVERRFLRSERLISVDNMKAESTFLVDGFNIVTSNSSSNLFPFSSAISESCTLTECYLFSGQ